MCRYMQSCRVIRTGWLCIFYDSTANDRLTDLNAWRSNLRMTQSAAPVGVRDCMKRNSLTCIFPEYCGFYLTNSYKKYE